MSPWGGAVSMAVSLPLVLDELGIEVKSSGIISRTPGIACLGSIVSIANVQANCPAMIGAYVWHAQPGWAPIDRMELERWLVDAPAGSHWLVSERKLVEIERIPTPPEIELLIWSESDLASWIGQAVLAGRLILNTDSSNISSSINAITNRTEQSTPPPPDAVAFKPKIQLTEWLSQRGYERLQVRPILLEGRCWEVEGHLLGPEDVKERHRWTLIEDPFSSNLMRLGDVEKLSFVPQLEKIAPHSWMTLEMVRSELPSVCEERRHWRVTQESAGGDVQGSILHWWRIEEQFAELISSPVLIPGWLVNFPSNGWMVVHGLSGEILNIA